MKLAVRHEIVERVESADRMRIAHLSDFHLWFSARKLADIEETLAPWKPDVLALTGDYADTPTGQRLMIEWVRRIATRYPLCWVAGNHDRWFGPAFLRRLAALNHAHAIEREDALITAARGVRCRFTTLARLSRASSIREDAAIVVLLHNPSAIDAARVRALDGCLLLAGHLHGGQVTLWRDRNNRPQPASSCYPWLADRREIGESTLIVSRGLGDTLPIRYDTPKEIVMIDYAVSSARRNAASTEQSGPAKAEEILAT